MDLATKTERQITALVGRMIAEADQKDAEIARLRAALEAVGVICVVSHGEPYCPWCGFMVLVGGAASAHARHAPDCPCQVALGLGEE